MRRDVMQTAGLELYAELAIIIFFVTFGLIALYTLTRRKADLKEVQELPLFDGVEVERG